MTPEPTASAMDEVLRDAESYMRDGTITNEQDAEVQRKCAEARSELATLRARENALREENARLRAALDKGVSHVCDSMRKWRDAIEARDDDDSHAVKALSLVFGMIGKSSMLDRLIYGCEPLRTEKCPKHKGTWRGLPSPENDCECGLTGWLPARTALSPAAREAGSCDHRFESNPGMYDTSHRYCAKCGVAE